VELLNRVGGDVDVDRIVVARVSPLVERSVTVERLRPGAEVGRGLARGDGEGVDTVFAAEGDVQRGGEPDIEASVEVECGGPLCRVECPVVEIALRDQRRGLLRLQDREQLCVRGVHDIDLVVIFAEGGRGVEVPADHRALDAAGQRIVEFLDLFERVETVRERIDGDAGRGDAGYLARHPVVLVVFREAITQRAEAVEFQVRRDVVSGVVFGVVKVELRIAVELVLIRITLSFRDVAVRESETRQRVAVDVLQSAVADAEICAVVVTFFQRDVQPAVLAERHALVEAPTGRRALAVVVLARGGVEHAAGRILLQDDVHNAGDGVGAILRRGAVGQHFDVVDRVDRDEAEVSRRRARVRAAAVDREVRGGMAALAVDQHQGIVRTQTPQRRLDGESPPVVSIFSDGTSVCSALARSIDPVFSRALEPTTWTGAALSAAVTPVCRVPVTITSETDAAGALPLASAVASAALAMLGAAIPIAMSRAVRLPPYINLFTS